MKPRELVGFDIDMAMVRRHQGRSGLLAEDWCGMLAMVRGELAQSHCDYCCDLSSEHLDPSCRNVWAH